jgi:hypothetical protein
LPGFPLFAQKRTFRMAVKQLARPAHRSRPEAQQVEGLRKQPEDAALKCLSLGFGIPVGGDHDRTRVLLYYDVMTE